MQSIHQINLPRRLRRLVVASFFVVVAIVGGGLAWRTFNGEAQFNQNDSTGSYLLTFQNSAGIIDKSNNVVISGGIATLPASESGHFTSSNIRPASFNGWRDIRLDGTWSNDGDAAVQLYTCSGGLLPDGDFAGNSAGVSISSSHLLSIANLSPNTYPCLRVKVLLGSSGTIAPTISKMTVSWTPLTVYGLRVSAAGSVRSGDIIQYNVDYSISYAQDHNVVLILPMPTAETGTFNPVYGQNLSLNFVSASGNGVYTPSDITVDGVNVPANSVYWPMSTVNPGTAGAFVAVFRTNNGLQNAIKYQTAAQVVSLNAGTKNSNPAVTTVASSPQTSIAKSSSNTIFVASESNTYVYEGSPWDSKAVYNISASAGGGIGSETLFNAVLTDDLTNVIDVLTTQCGVSVGDLPLRFTVPTPGVLDLGAKTITWTAGHLTPNNGFNASFTVDYYGCTPTTDVTNTVKITADNETGRTASATLRLFGIQETKAFFAKGDSVNGSTSVSANSDDNRPSADPQNSSGKTAYGDTTTYQLLTTNEGLNRIDDVVMTDIIPAGTEFVSASIPGNTGGTIYYSTNPSAVQPTFDHTNLASPGADWSSTLPSTPTDVKWVAFYLPCLQSKLIASGGSCVDKPSSVTASITVRVPIPSGSICNSTDISNTANFTVYSASVNPNNQSDGDVVTLATPLTGQDTELTHAAAPMPNLRATTISGPSTINAGDLAVYTVAIHNAGSADTDTDTTVTISLPSLTYGTLNLPLSFVGLSGADFQLATDSSGNITSVTVKPGVVSKGTTRTFTLTLAAPTGVLDNTPYTLQAAVSAADTNQCQNLTVSTQTRTAIMGSALINSIKTHEQSLINSGDKINYNIRVNSAGTASASQTYIVDQIPTNTTFSEAYTSAPDANFVPHNCTNCQVYFATANANLPASILNNDQISISDVVSYFTLGVETASGVWVQPASMTPEQVLYVAYLIDDPNYGVLPVGADVTVGLEVTSDPSLNSGAIITNAPAIISRQTLQTIPNVVQTIVLNEPSLHLTKTANTDTVLPDGTFEWYVDYVNDSSADSYVVSVADTLPSNVQLTGVYNTWNQVTVSNYGGVLTSGEQQLADQSQINSLTGGPNIDFISNSDGSLSVVVRIVPTTLQQLAPQEGGRLRFTVRAAANVSTGTYLLNTATGCYQNDVVGPYCITDDSVVEVRAPDLWLRKSVTNPAPRLDTDDSYSLILSNEGPVAADGVEIVDTLPAGVCFVSMEMITPAIYNTTPSLGAGNCANQSTTVTWQLGQLPAASGNIILQYKVHIHPSVGQGTTVSNRAVASTTTPEDDILPNEAVADLTTLRPNAYVTKSASSGTVLPGETFRYSLSYGNKNDETAHGVYLVDALPDYDGDGLTDVVIESVNVPNFESVYYYDANVSGPLSAKNISAGYGFAADPDFKSAVSAFDAVTTYPTHIIITGTGLAGNGTLGYYENSGNVIISARAVNPFTNVHLPANIEFINYVKLDQTSLDSDLTDNESIAKVSTPTADLFVAKTATSEGAFPGVAAGDSITYTVDFGSISAASICGVYIVDDLPAQLQSISHNFTNLHLTDRSGHSTVFPVDASGVKILSTVPITYSNNSGQARWYLGTTTDPLAADYYENVCLPSSAYGSFQITGLTDENTADSTVMTNHVQIDHDSPAPELYLDNNTSESTTYIYRANLTLTKTALSAGGDDTFGTADDSDQNTNTNEKVRYTFSYNNHGHTDARNSVIAESIPRGMCFTDGSIANLPADATVEYSNDEGSTYGATPFGCNTTNFRIKLGTLSAPANLLAGQITVNAQPTADPSLLHQTSRFSQISPAINATIVTSTCALRDDGTVWCWGSSNNFINATGSGAAFGLTPVKLPGISRAVQLTVGRNMLCVLLDDGTVWCQGINSSGQIGSGEPATSNILSLRQVGGATPLTDVKQISAGSQIQNVCAVKNDGTAWCWGDNFYGQIGDGTRQIDRLSPVQVGGATPLTDVKQISVGFTVCALKNDGTVWCHGYMPAAGLLATTYQATPVPIIDNVGNVIQGFQQISLGEFTACGIKTDKSLWCWGRNTYGTLGSGTINSPSLSKVPVQVGSDFASVSLTGHTAFAIKPNGSLWVWGLNGGLALGQGNTNVAMPTQIPNLSNVTSVGLAYSSTTYYTVCALIGNNETAECWGLAEGGMLGTSATGTVSSPTANDALAATPPTQNKLAYQYQHFANVATGDTYTCAVTDDGVTYCWGLINGQLGSLSLNSPVPVPVADGVDLTQIISGGGHTCAVSSGQVSCYGNNVYGQLGDGTYTNAPSTGPTRVLLLPQPTNTERGVTLSLPTGASISAYGDIYLEQKTGDATFPGIYNPNAAAGTVNYYIKQMVGATCALSNPDAPGFSGPVWTTAANTHDSVKISASTLPASVDKWCVAADYTGSGDLTTSVRLSYVSPDDARITFDAVVDDPTETLIINTAVISTSTPETTLADNVGQAELRLLSADLSVQKTVDKAVVSIGAASGGTEVLTYSLVVSNNGPNAAAQPQVVDNLPANVHFVSAAQTSASQGAGVNFTCAESAGVVTCDSAAPLPVGASATITVTATIDGSVNEYDQVPNHACVSAYTADLYANNDCDTALTTIATAPNIYVIKNGPTSANVNKTFDYTLTFGNNGNELATAWQLSDTVDSNLIVEAVNVVSTSGVSDLTCDFSGQTVSCATTSGEMPAGALVVASVTVRVVENYSLADNLTVIPNQVCTATADSQVNISDDCDDHNVTVVPGNGSVISGRVFTDHSGTVNYDSVLDSGIAGVTVTLTGVNSAGQNVSLTATTDASGQYNFYNLRPGTYTISETQPSGYLTTGSRGGYLGLDSSNQPIVSPRDGRGSVQDVLVSPDEVVDVVLVEGEYSRENNFGEITASIGYLVWNDADADGALDDNETGIAGVEVSLYADADGDGQLSAADVLAGVTNTNMFGHYGFSGLTFGKYIVVVSDGSNLLDQMTNSAQNASGFAVELTAGAPSSMHANFGFYQTQPPSVPGVTVPDTNVPGAPNTGLGWLKNHLAVVVLSGVILVGAIGTLLMKRKLRRG